MTLTDQNPNSGYDPGVQDLLLNALGTGQATLTELQKETGTSRPELYEAAIDLSSLKLVSLTRTAQQVTVEPSGSFSAARTPLVPAGRVVHAGLPGNAHGEQRGKRPAIVISKNQGHARPVMIVVPLTSNCERPLETTVKIPATDANGLKEDSLALCHNIQTLSKDEVLSIFGRTDKALSEVRATVKGVLSL